MSSTAQKFVLSNSFTGRIDVPFNQTISNKDRDYEIIFNRLEWKIVAVAFGVNATQTALPLGPSTAKLTLSTHILSETPDGQAQLGSGTIAWNAFDYQNVKGWDGVRNVTVLTPPQKVYIRFKHTYDTAGSRVGEHCDYTDFYAITLEALVSNPATTPSAGETKESTTDPPPGNFDLGSFLGGLGTGALIAGAAIVFLLLYTRR